MSYEHIHEYLFIVGVGHQALWPVWAAAESLCRWSWSRPSVWLPNSLPPRGSPWRGSASRLLYLSKSKSPPALFQLRTAPNPSMVTLHCFRIFVLFPHSLILTSGRTHSSRKTFLTACNVYFATKLLWTPLPWAPFPWHLLLTSPHCNFLSVSPPHCELLEVENCL